LILFRIAWQVFVTVGKSREDVAFVKAGFVVASNRPLTGALEPTARTAPAGDFDWDLSERLPGQSDREDDSTFSGRPDLVGSVSRHRVEAGDCLHPIAAAHGTAADILFVGT